MTSFRERIRLAPETDLSRGLLVSALGHLGEIDEARRIWAELVRRYGPSLVLLAHHPAAELSEGIETLDLVRIGADDSPHWSSVWPTPEDNLRHGGLELWMATDGHWRIGL